MHQYHIMCGTRFINPIITELSKLNNEVTMVPEITMFKINDLLETLHLIKTQII
jgi:hypothetical protein